MSGQLQTLDTPPPVSVQTLLYGIYQASVNGGGGGTWGSITGTLSNQSDLQTALNDRSISNTRIYYVDSASGNDVTAQIGNPAKPYATAQAAYDDAETAGVFYSIHLGYGDYSITLSSSMTGPLKSMIGMGASGYETDKFTKLTIIAGYEPTDAVIDANGGNGFTVSIPCVFGIYLDILTSGQSVTATNAGSFTAGNAASIDVSGSNFLIKATANGGGDYISTDGTVSGGDGGSITLFGAYVENQECLAGSNFNSVDGSVGQCLVKFCDFTVWQPVNPGENITAGNSAFPLGWTLDSDKGGNSFW
jgi:hypothetical protein